MLLQSRQSIHSLTAYCALLQHAKLTEELQELVGSDGTLAYPQFCKVQAWGMGCQGTDRFLPAKFRPPTYPVGCRGA